MTSSVFRFDDFSMKNEIRSVHKTQDLALTIWPTWLIRALLP